MSVPVEHSSQHVELGNGKCIKGCVKFAKTISIPDVTARDVGNKEERQMATDTAAVNGQNMVLMFHYLFHVTFPFNIAYISTSELLCSSSTFFYATLCMGCQRCIEILPSQV